MQRMQTLTVAERYDVLAPDSSEIRLLVSTDRGSMVHCTLAAGRTSLAVRHRTVEEVWYFLGGRGEVWRKLGGEEQVVAVKAGVSLTVPTGAHFQFRAIGAKPLTFRDRNHAAVAWRSRSHTRCRLLAGAAWFDLATQQGPQNALRATAPIPSKDASQRSPERKGIRRE